MIDNEKTFTCEDLAEVLARPDNHGKPVLVEVLLANGDTTIARGRVVYTQPGQGDALLLVAVATKKERKSE